MSDLVRIGKQAKAVEQSPAFPPFSKVVIIVGEDTNGNQLVYEAGDNSGRTLEFENPWGTQAIANNVLAQVRGYAYKPYTATGALLDPAAEIGDSVSVNGVQSVLAASDTTFGRLMAADIMAPEEGDIDHEYPYETSQNREIARKLNTITTNFTVEIGRIEGEISDTDSNLRTLISQRLDNITLSVSSNNGSSTFTLKDGSTTLDTETLNLTVSAVNVSGRLTASQIDATYLHVNAANIDGTITAGNVATGRVSLGDVGEMGTSMYSSSSWGGKLYFESYAAMHLSADSGDVYIGAGLYQSNYRSTIQIYNDYPAKVAVKGNLLPQSSATYSLGANGLIWSQVWANNATIQTSDREKKEHINYDVSKYDALFDKLKPCAFEFTGNEHDRVHLGLVAQDVELALQECKIDTREMGAFIKSENPDTKGIDYGLRYTELIPLLIWEVQKLKAKVKELTA